MDSTPRRFAYVLLAIGLTVAACGSDGDAQPTGSEPSSSNSGDNAVSGEVTVFAAASLTDAFTELGAAFTAANPEVEVTFSFAASSELVAQIVEGAPADVFASADVTNMSKLVDADGVAGEPLLFANNLSEIIVAPGNPLGITGVADLADPGLILVTCAPEVPCGSYATQIFANADIEVTPDSLEENVKAVVTKVTLGEADAGIAYATDVLAAGDDAAGVEIPAELNVVAEYPIALTAGAAGSDAAQAFVDFVTGSPGQSILASYGFASP